MDIVCKPSNKKQNNIVYVKSPTKIKKKSGDWKKLDLFLQYTVFLGKHAVMLSAQACGR
jgi:hypothetical protein